MSRNHQLSFNNHEFFVSFSPDVSSIYLCFASRKQTRQFVFVNYCGHENFAQFHGKVIVLDIMDRHAPFPSLFIIHEKRVRGYHPFAPLTPAMPDEITWQDWTLSGSMLNSSGGFIRDGPPGEGNNSVPAQLQCQPTGSTFIRDSPSNGNNVVPAQTHFQPTTERADGAPHGTHPLALNADVINDILAATRAMPS